MPIASLLLAVFLPVPSPAAAPAPAAVERQRLETLLAQFAPVDIKADVSALSPGDRQALAKLIQAAQVIDSLFLRQEWEGSGSMLLSLAKDQSPLGRARLSFFTMMKGPWDRQNGNVPVIAGAPAKPAQAAFYPADATKAEVQAWFQSLPPAEKGKAEGFFTTVRRDPAGKLMAVPYSVEYQDELQLAARLLREAAALTTSASLKSYLEKRAAAFLSNDYYDSDVAWMELDSPIEPTIGPYENYEDDWFNDKAAFEAFVCLRDAAETAKLQSFSTQLQWLEDHLPIEPAHRNPKLGALAPIRVVNEVFDSGDASHGVQTAAYNLPNDERVTREKGSKRTMLKNIQQAKFQVILLPLAKLALGPEDRKNVDFDAFFTHILMHELMHGLGPHDIVVDGKATTARQALQETFSSLEEAKADISGLWALQQLIDKGVLDKKLERSIYVTFLASGFRTLRFGATEAHGKGMALQLNYLAERGGVVARKDGTFSIDPAKIKPAVEALTREIMEIQARGDRAAAQALLAKYGALTPQESAVLEKAKSLPIDIAPRFVTAEQLLGERP